MSSRIVNRDYVLVIKSENDLLEAEEIEMNIPRDLLKKLVEMMNNKHLSILDVQDVYLRSFPKEVSKMKKMNYLFPFKYNSSFNNVYSVNPIFYNSSDFPFHKVTIGSSFFQEVPKYCYFPSAFDTKKDYEESIACQESIIFNRLYEQFKKHYLKQNGYHDVIEELEKLEASGFNYIIKDKTLKEDYETKVIKKTADKIKQLKNDLRYFFAQGVIRYILAVCYENAKNSLDESVLMFSTDSIGWTTYDHNITSDARIELHSNFGYGASSYFYCNLYYKDVPILPYSDVVKYPFVSWIQFVNYTRSYSPTRETCWEESFDFIVEITNLIKCNPEKFINDYVVGELQILFSTLRDFLDMKSRDIIRFYNKYEQKDRCTIFVWNTGIDKEAYMIYPKEFAESEKIEKITGCLYILDNLKKIKVVIPVVEKFIDELLLLNDEIRPMIELNIDKLSSEIKQNEKKLQKLISIRDDNDSQMKIMIESSSHDFLYLLALKPDKQNDYLKKHQELKELYRKYDLLDKKLNAVKLKIFYLENNIRLRNSFLDRFKECKERIETLML